MSEESASAPKAGRILFIDDDPAMTKLVRVALAPRYRVAVAADGESGLASALGEPPDAIVCNLRLPGMSGEEVVLQLRQHEILDDVPIIVLSGRGEEDLRVRLLRGGAQDYLLKPVSAAELEARVDCQVSGARARRLLQDELQLSQRDLVILVRSMAERNAELEASRAQLQNVSRRLVEVQEAERRHLARELHDQVGQVLTALKLQLEVAARRSDDEGRPWLREAVGLADQLIGIIRGISLQLRPALLDDLGLASALSWLFEQVQKQSSLRVTFHHHGLPRRMPPDVEIALYRVAQEALTNVARHAGVGKARVALEADDLSVRLSVEDRGAGFDPKSTRLTAAGLPGMRERILAVNGSFHIESSTGGTRVVAVVPLPSSHSPTDTDALEVPADAPDPRA